MQRNVHIWNLLHKNTQIWKIQIFLVTIKICSSISVVRIRMCYGIRFILRHCWHYRRWMSSYLITWHIRVLKVGFSFSFFKVSAFIVEKRLMKISTWMESSYFVRVMRNLGICFKVNSSTRYTVKWKRCFLKWRNIFSWIFSLEFWSFLSSRKACVSR